MNIVTNAVMLFERFLEYSYNSPVVLFVSRHGECNIITLLITL